jgi:hypothetical protein
MVNHELPCVTIGPAPEKHSGHNQARHSDADETQTEHARDNLSVGREARSLRGVRNFTAVAKANPEVNHRRGTSGQGEPADDTHDYWQSSHAIAPVLMPRQKLQRAASPRQ